MKLTDLLRDALAMPYLASTGHDAVGLESPWASPNHLVTITPPDGTGYVSRTTAMSVPAIKRARNILVGSIARCPLEARTNGRRADNQPIWLNRTDGIQSPFFRMTWTIDDLLFYGWSLWGLKRDSDGAVIRADRVPYHLWDIDANGRVTINGNAVDQQEICLIPGVDEGLLDASSETVRHAAEINRMAARAARNPSAQIDLHQTSGQPLTREQARALIDDWSSARRGENGGVAYTSQTIEARELGKSEPQILVEGRTMAAVDCARAVGVPASLVDAHQSGAGNLTYHNQDARNVELVDYGLAPFMAAVAARLGLDDMVPRGHAVAFDLRDLTGPTVGDLDVPDDDNQTVPDDDSRTQEDNRNA